MSDGADSVEEAEMMTFIRPDSHSARAHDPDGTDEVH